MKKKATPRFVLLLCLSLVSITVSSVCSDSKKKENAPATKDQHIEYEIYYNDLFDFSIAYPSKILIPQEEPDNIDGQRFLHKDGESFMLVYHTIKTTPDGNTLPLNEAYQEDQLNKKITEKRIEEKYYYLEGDIEKKRFLLYTILSNENYYTIYFEYKKQQEKLFKEIADHVSGSLNLPGANDETTNLIFNFLNECFWNKNFNSLLVNRSHGLEKYIGINDVARYYNPGSTTHLYTRGENFGFDALSDFETIVNDEVLGGEYLLLNKMPERGINRETTSEDGVYYTIVNKLPVATTRDLEIVKVDLPERSQILLIEVVLNQRIIKSFYFVKNSDEEDWKLAFVDDSDV